MLRRVLLRRLVVYPSQEVFPPRNVGVGFDTQRRGAIHHAEHAAAQLRLRDDPAFAFITINESVLSRTIAIFEAWLKEMEERLAHISETQRRQSDREMS